MPNVLDVGETGAPVGKQRSGLIPRLKFHVV
jgi:hypothetical protein